MPDIYERIAESFIGASKEIATLYPSPARLPPRDTFAQYFRDRMPREEVRFGEEEEEEEAPEVELVDPNKWLAAKLKELQSMPWETRLVEIRRQATVADITLPESYERQVPKKLGPIEKWQQVGETVIGAVSAPLFEVGGVGISSADIAALALISFGIYQAGSTGWNMLLNKVLKRPGELNKFGRQLTRSALDREMSRYSKQTGVKIPKATRNSIIDRYLNDMAASWVRNVGGQVQTGTLNTQTLQRASQGAYAQSLIIVNRELGLIPRGTQTGAIAFGGVAPGIPPITPAISKKIVHAHNTMGGASFDMLGKNLVGTDAFAVGIQTEQAVFLPKEKITAADIDSFVRKNAALLSQPQHILGTWFDKETGQSVLVVSVLRPDIQSAVGLAQQQGQLEIYDLKTQERLVTSRRIISKFSEIKPFEFARAISKAPRPAFLTRYSQQELGGFRLFLSQDKLIGFAIKPDGDLVNVFNASAIAGAGEEAVVQAIVHGATKLDAMDVPFLRYYYEDAGFRVARREPWNDAYAPKDWDYKKYGRPDIIYMEYRGGQNAVDIRAGFRAARVRRLSTELRGKEPPARPVTALGERERGAVPGAIIPPAEEPLKGILGVPAEPVVPPEVAEVVAADYDLLLDNLKELRSTIIDFKDPREIEAISNLFRTFLRPPESETYFRTVPKTTLERVELRIREAEREPAVDRMRLVLDASIAELEQEMRQIGVEAPPPPGPPVPEVWERFGEVAKPATLSEIQAAVREGVKGEQLDALLARGKPPVVPPPTGPPAPPAPPIVPPPAAVTPTPPPVGPPPPAEEMMADLQNFDEMAAIAFKPDMWRAIANLPAVRSLMNVFGPAATANTPAAQAMIGRAMLRHEGQQKTQGVISYLNRLGTQEQVFGKLDAKGLIAEGPFKGTAVNTIRTYPGRYANKMTPAQKAWVEQANVIEQAKLAFLKRNEIEIKQLTFEEGGQYAGRRVFAKVKVTQGEPEVLETGYVGAGPGRPGAKLAAEKHRIFKTEEEAIAAGFRYLPEDEALYLNVSGAYNRVADKQMADWLLLRVPWRTTAAPEELKLASYAAKQKLNRSRALRGALNRAVRGERVPGVTISSIARAFPDQADRLKALIPRIQAGESTARDVQALTREANDLIKTSQLEWYKARSATARARELAMRPKYGEAIIPAPAFAGKIITGPEAREIAGIIRDQMAPGFNKALGAINKVNAIARFFMLAGDLSPMTIQLLFWIGAYPKEYGKASLGLIKAIFDPEFHANYLVKHNATIQKSRNLILTKSGATEFTEAMARGGLLAPERKLLPADEMLLKKAALLPPRVAAKVGAKALQPFQRGFEACLDVAGIELREALDYMCTTPERTAGVEQFINEIRGLTSSARIGVSVRQRQAETTAILAPRYNRATAGVFFDAFRGTIRGSLVRKFLAKGGAALAAIAIVLSYAMGEDTDEVVEHLNPTSPMFLTWQVAGQKVGPGSKFRSVIKLFGQSASDPEKVLELSMDNPGLRWIRGNFSPVISTGYDLLTGRDYIGDPTRDGILSFSETIAENFMPIWTQTTLLEGGTVGERAVRAGAEFLGMRGYPDPWGKLADMRNKEAMTRHSKDYDALNRLQQKEINEVPGIKELQEQSEAESARRATGFRGEVDDFFAEGDRIEAYRSEKLWEIHNQMIGGAITPGDANSAYWSLGTEISGMYEARDINPRYDKVREYLEERATEKEKEEEGKEIYPGDKAYYEYQKLFEQADTEGWSSEMISQQIEMLWRKYPGAEQYVTQLQEVGKDWPPSYLQYRRARGKGMAAFKPARMAPVGAGGITPSPGVLPPYKVR